MVSRTQIPFYDEDNGVFRTNEPDFKLAVHLGEDVDNPLVSFRHAEKNLLLQKYLTSLTKEKMDLLVQINLCMTRLDEIEKYLGINIANKRNKKSMINQKKQ